MVITSNYFTICDEFFIKQTCINCITKYLLPQRKNANHLLLHRREIQPLNSRASPTTQKKRRLLLHRSDIRQPYQRIFYYTKESKLYLLLHKREVLATELRGISYFTKESLSSTTQKQKFRNCNKESSTTRRKLNSEYSIRSLRYFSSTQPQISKNPIPYTSSSHKQHPILYLHIRSIQLRKKNLK